MSLKIVMWLR